MALSGIREFPIIGADSPNELLDAGKMAWPHGFHLRYIAVDPGASSKRHARAEEEVILLQSGSLIVELADGTVTIGPGDVLTIPIGMPRAFSNAGDEMVEAYVVRGGDHPSPPRLID